MSARCRVMCGCADQRHRGVLRMHPRQSCEKAIQGSVGISRCTRQGGLHEDTGKHVRCTRSHARDVGIWVQQRWPIAIPDSTSARGAAAAAAADSVARDSLLGVRSSFRADRDRKSAGGKRGSVLRAVRTTRRAQFPTHGCSGRVQFRRPSGRPAIGTHEMLLAKPGFVLPGQADQSGANGLGWMGGVRVTITGDTRLDVQVARK